jgi:predicted ester cyclase
MRRNNEGRPYIDLRFTIDDTIAERDEVVVHWTGTGTHKGQFLGMAPTNKKVSVSGTTIFRIEGSKIAEEWAHWNLLSMMEQLGINVAPKVESNAPKTKSKAHA